MQMRPDIQIQSAIKALTDVVLPALPPDHTLAREQGQLVIGLLQLMARQIPLQHRYDCDELARLLVFAEQLSTTAGRSAAATQPALSAQAASARDVAQRAGATSPQALQQAIGELRAATGAVVTEVFAGDDTARQDAVQAVVLAYSAEQLLRERAWFLPQRWEPDPESVTDILSLLGED